MPLYVYPLSKQKRNKSNLCSLCYHFEDQFEQNWISFYDAIISGNEVANVVDSKRVAGGEVLL